LRLGSLPDMARLVLAATVFLRESPSPERRGRPSGVDVYADTLYELIA